MPEKESSKFKVQSSKFKVGTKNLNDAPFVEGELLEVFDAESLTTEQKNKLSKANEQQDTKEKKTVRNPQSAIRNYLLLPFVFLTIALLGGLRVGGKENDFLFFKPHLICLVFAAILLALFFRAGLIKINNWFSEEFSVIKNAASAAILLALFAASAQVFNALLPESGLPFWIVAFCFFWTLWNNLFAEFDAKKLVKSLGGLFGLAFVVKYLLLANIAAPANESWWRGIVQNPAREAFTYLLDLPGFSAATGYIQFFTLLFYLIGLFLLPPSLVRKNQ